MTPPKVKQLPMPWTGARTFGRNEWDEYRVRGTQHLALNPDYDLAFRRPTVETANRIFDLVAWERGRPIADLIPSYDWLREDERKDLEPVAKMGLVVVLDAAVLCGERGRMLTTNTIFDALGRRWSDHYREVLETTLARISYDMRRERHPAILRDLMRNGLLFEELLKAAQKGVPGLYSARRSSGRGRARGYDITLETPLMDDFLNVVRADRMYRRTSGPHRIWLASDPEDPEDPGDLDDDMDDGAYPHRVAAERPYNVALSGDRGKDIIRVLESTRLRADAPTIGRDVAAWEEQLAKVREELEAFWSVQERGPDGEFLKLPPDKSQTAAVLFARRDRLKGLVASYGPIRDQLTEPAEIRSRFYIGLDRRYYTTNFSPTEVTTKETHKMNLDIDDVDVRSESSHRGRWFDTGDDILVGLDVKSSQLQILAAFLGDKELEAIAPKIKSIAAERAREMFTIPKSLTDEQLQATCKQAIMTHLYGSDLKEVAHKIHANPLDYGPSEWVTPESLAALLHHPDLHLSGVLRFLEVCQRVAEIAYAKDPVAGVVMPDLLDRIDVRWNPVARHMTRVAGDGSFKIYADLPGAPSTTGKYVGDYPVDLQKLRRTVCPNLVHMMDALYSSAVVDTLRRCGVRNIGAIHDCWFVAYEDREFLPKAMWFANQLWLVALGPVYDGLLAYLEDQEYGDPQLAEWVRGLKTQWERRRETEDWPNFEAGPAKLVTVYLETPAGDIVVATATTQEDIHRLGLMKEMVATGRALEGKPRH